MTDVKLGQLPDQYAQRDAIHIAVCPVEAAEDLEPGQYVGLVAQPGLGDRLAGLWASASAPHVGIVDPFLTTTVKKGQRFWLCLYPQTVTSIRHHWTHPKIAEAEDIASLEAEKESERWLRDFAAHVSPYDMDDDPSGQRAFETLLSGFQTGNIFTHGTSYTPDPEEEEELRQHLERYLKVKIDRLSFSCSC